MAVAKISKAEFYIHKSDVDDVLSILQNTGSYEIIPFNSDEETDGPTLTHPDLPRVDFLLGETRFLLRFLEPHFKDPVSGLARAMGEKDEISLSKASELDSSTDIAASAEEVRTLERRTMEIRSEISHIDSTLSLLESLEGFPYPLELLSVGTERVKGVLGSLPISQIDEWSQEAEALLGDMGEMYIVPGGERDKFRIAALFFDVSLLQKVGELNGAYLFNKIDIPSTLLKGIQEELSRLEKRKALLLGEEEQILIKIGEAAEKTVPVARALNDYYAVLRDRYEALSRGGATEQVVMLRGWIPDADLNSVRKSLADFDSSIELILSDPEPGDDVPTLMNNPVWCLPFENLTRLYGVPGYHEMDPTPLMAPFFFVFFGMCLGDAGYGLIMIGLFTWFLKKYKKMPRGFSEFFKLFVLSGVATMIVGTLTGSWFGDMVDAFAIFSFLRPLKNLPVILNPMDDPMVFLALSLALGVFQLLFGLGVAFYDALRRKDYMGAYADVGGWLVFLIGLLVWGMGLAGYMSVAWEAFGKTVAIFGAIVLLATQGREKTGFISKAISGVLSLYDATSYLGDVLSYSRLLALGLATSAVGVIINMLAGLAGDIPFVGWILALLLIIGGHVFSVAVNVLGAFVHSLRLQYVEFFSKFYSGGGRVFSPLSYNTSYVSIKREPVE
ncbi:MAG: V-type ATP synthase subunit I [Aminivibrio sp.]|jgi:V/A-type H+-transporting ATPase subunit I